MQNHYKFLGISESATQSEIKKAYRKLALKHHPDKSKSAESIEIFKKLVEVYDVLSDPQKKKLYDIKLAQLTKDSLLFRKGGPQTTTTFAESRYYWHYPPNSNKNTYATYSTHSSTQSHTRVPPSAPPKNGAHPPPPPHQNTYPHDEDDFDFAYKRNQTHYDSFSSSRSYFTPNNNNANGKTYNHPPTAKNQKSTGSFKTGASFQRTTVPPPSANGSTSANKPFPNRGSYKHQQRSPNANNDRNNPPQAAYASTSTQGYQRQQGIPPHNVRPPQNGMPNNSFKPYNSYYTHPPPPPPPPSNSNPAGSYRYTQSSTSMPSMPADPLPKSWQKQQANFKNSFDQTSNPPLYRSVSPQEKNAASVPPSSAENHSNSDDKSESPNPCPPRVKTPPAKNRPSNGASRKNGTIDELFSQMKRPLKFDIGAFDTSAKSTPRNVRTQNIKVNKNERSGLPSQSRSPSLSSASSSNSSTFQTSSGRPPRTTLEEEDNVEYRTEPRVDTISSDEEEVTIHIDDTVDDKEEKQGNGKKRDGKKAEEPDDELVEIDATTFHENAEAAQEKTFKKQKSSMDFEELKNTTPMTQTNGNFNMNDISHVLEESNDDLLQGKKLKKRKNVHVQEITLDMLGFEHYTKTELLKPVLCSGSRNDWDNYCRQFEDFQIEAFNERKKLVEYLDVRQKRDHEHLGAVFRSDYNMATYDEVLENDATIALRLCELNRMVSQVLNEYKELNKRFDKE